METKTGIKVSEKEIADFLNAIPDARRPTSRVFTATEDTIILAVWKQNKDKKAAAKALDISYTSLKTRYDFLTGGKK